MGTGDNRGGTHASRWYLKQDRVSSLPDNVGNGRSLTRRKVNGRLIFWLYVKGVQRGKRREASGLRHPFIPGFEGAILSSRLSHDCIDNSVLGQIFSLESLCSALVIHHDDLGVRQVEARQDDSLCLPCVDEHGYTTNHVDSPIEDDVLWAIATDNGHLITFLDPAVDELLPNKLNLLVDIFVGKSRVVVDDIFLVKVSLQTFPGCWVSVVPDWCE